MANKYGKVRLDLMHGTTNPADLVSVKYQVTVSDTTTDTAIENGNVVVIGALISGEREVYAASKPTATSTKGSIALIATPELIYDQSTHKNVNEFRNEAGDIARAYRLVTGDVFGITMESVAGRATMAAVTVGDVVELKADTKLNVVATLTSGSTQIGTVIAKEGDYVVIRVM